MKVARLASAGDIRVLDEPTPEPGPDEALIKVASVGLCGSDIHWFQEAGIGDARLDRPLILGHEFAGWTETGELVAVDPAVPCGQCEFCQQGNPNLCAQIRFAGHGHEDGALREYLAWPKRCLYPLPDALRDDEGAMLEPLGVALHSVDLGKIRPGMSVGVFGCGPIGSLVVQVAHLAGAVRIFASEILPQRLQMACSFGAEPWTMNSEVDVAFECAGENAAVEAAFAAAKPGGRVILVGIPRDDRTSFSASVARRKGLSIKVVRRMKHTYPRAIRLVAGGLIDVRSLVTHRYPLEKTSEAFESAAHRAGMKVMVECGSNS